MENTNQWDPDRALLSASIAHTYPKRELILVVVLKMQLLPLHFFVCCGYDNNGYSDGDSGENSVAAATMKENREAQMPTTRKYL